MFLKLTDYITQTMIYYNFDKIISFKEEIEDGKFNYTILNTTLGNAAVSERARDIYLKLEAK